MDLLRGLNSAQRAAVEHEPGPMLVLAGAGSGKTRVLTHRIAHLISKFQIDPRQIFAVTFTNKAAAEMRHRVFELLSSYFDLEISAEELWVSTFHSACVRILRSDIHHLGYSNQFTIYDDSDQRSVVKACLKELNIADSTYNPKLIQARINKVKNDGFDHETYRPSFSGPQEDVFVQVFQRYSEVLRQSSALDFADLILVTVKLFKQHPKVLEAYHQRFQHYLIDEYQDTNRCQYEFMKLLASKSHSICAVGDEDQSIYRWRGADISNILNFEKDYPNTKIFKLEQNYRSTKNIIEAASRVISYNVERREKSLWTDNDDGEKIAVLEAYDEHDEAHKLVNEVAGALSAGVALNQTAVFYRTNAQSRLIEDMLRTKGVNYEIYGGLKFYDRLEIKDALAYLKLVTNPDDDVSFRRIVNVPARGIGAVSLKKFSAFARENGVSLYRLLDMLFGKSPKATTDILGRTAKKFEKFYQVMENLKEASRDLLPSDLLNYTLEETGYRDSLRNQDSVEARSRLENLAELRQGIVEYELRCGAEQEKASITLDGFLEQVALVADIDRFDSTAPAMKLMTIHMAKGLEFDFVFIVGLEEELFPNVRPWEGEDPNEVEEERRLFYVGMTRARKKLTLLFAKNRTVFGNSQYRTASRFIDELPEQYVETKRADYFSRRRPYVDRPGLVPSRAVQAPMVDEYSQLPEYEEEAIDTSDDEMTEDLSAGRQVEHPHFGRGIIRKVIDRDKAMIEFRGGKMRKISLKFGLLKTL